MEVLMTMNDTDDKWQGTMNGGTRPMNDRLTNSRKQQRRGMGNKERQGTMNRRNQANERQMTNGKDDKWQGTTNSREDKWWDIEQTVGR
jgi:hypothetical protein